MFVAFQNFEYKIHMLIYCQLRSIQINDYFVVYLANFMQATPRLTEDTVKQCVDPRLKGEYPPKGVAKVCLFPSIPSLCACFHVVVTAIMSSKQHLEPIFNSTTVLFYLLQLAAVAALCVQYESEFRPSMSIVVKALSPLLQHKPQPPPAAALDAKAPSRA